MLLRTICPLARAARGSEAQHKEVPPSFVHRHRISIFAAGGGGSTDRGHRLLSGQEHSFGYDDLSTVGFARTCAVDIALTRAPVPSSPLIQLALGTRLLTDDYTQLWTLTDDEDFILHIDAVFLTPAQIFWPQGGGETVTAWKAGVDIEVLEQMKNIEGLASFRTCERLKLTGAAEHGHVSLLIYNQHQPSSRKRPFPQKQRIIFGKRVLEDAIRSHADDSSNVGFIFGGDANCDDAELQRLTIADSHKCTGATPADASYSATCVYIPAQGSRDAPSPVPEFEITVN